MYVIVLSNTVLVDREEDATNVCRLDQLAKHADGL